MLSCYNYREASKNVDINPKKKAYELELSDHTRLQVKNLKIDDRQYKYKDMKGKNHKIATADVATIRIRKYNYIKTVGLTLGIISAIILSGYLLIMASISQTPK